MNLYSRKSFIGFFTLKILQGICCCCYFLGTILLNNDFLISGTILFNLARLLKYIDVNFLDNIVLSGINFEKLKVEENYLNSVSKEPKIINLEPDLKNLNNSFVNILDKNLSNLRNSSSNSFCVNPLKKNIGAIGFISLENSANLKVNIESDSTTINQNESQSWSKVGGNSNVNESEMPYEVDTDWRFGIERDDW